jgi:O-antigen/teichoic acid export membrane protein
LYSLCFSEPVIRYWVGLDKYGGTMLLSVAVFAKIVSQIRSYFNNIIYTGGLINKSAKLDIICTFLYVVVLLIIIKGTQIYAIPIATSVSCVVFLIWYVLIIKKYLLIKIRPIINIALKSILVTIPFVLLHFLCQFNYNHIITYTVYFVLFSIIYISVIYLLNKEMTNQIFVKLFKHR